MIDLDNFKEINDLYVHQEGDEVIKGFSKVLTNVFQNSLVSRFGGDEFLVISEGYTEEDLLRLKQEVYEELKNPMHISPHIEDLRFSYGYSFNSSNESKTLDELVVEADNNMYKDKAINKNYRRRKSDR